MYPIDWTLKIIVAYTFCHRSDSFFIATLGMTSHSTFVSWVDLSYQSASLGWMVAPTSFSGLGGLFITPFASWVDLSYQQAITGWTIAPIHIHLVLIFQKFWLYLRTCPWYNLFACRYIMAFSQIHTRGMVLGLSLIHFSLFPWPLLLRVCLVNPSPHWESETRLIVPCGLRFSSHSKDRQLFPFHKISKSVSSDTCIVGSFFNGESKL